MICILSISRCRKIFHRKQCCAMFFRTSAGKMKNQERIGLYEKSACGLILRHREMPSIVIKCYREYLDADVGSLHFDSIVGHFD